MLSKEKWGESRGGQGGGRWGAGEGGGGASTEQGKLDRLDCLILTTSQQ